MSDRKLTRTKTKKTRRLSGGSRGRSPRRRSRSASPRRRSRSASPRRRSRSRSRSRSNSRSNSSSEKCPVCYEQGQLEKYHTCEHGICPGCYATMKAVPPNKAGVGTGPKAVCPLCRAPQKPPDYRPEGYNKVTTSFFCGCPDPEHCYH